MMMIIIITIIIYIDTKNVPNGMTMTKVERRHYLAEEATRLLRREATLLHQIIKEFTTRHVLQNEIAVCAETGPETETGGQGWY